MLTEREFADVFIAGRRCALLNGRNEARARHVRDAIAEAERNNTAAFGGTVLYRTFVDGIESSDLDRVRPNGEIRATFDLMTDMLAWIEQQLIIRSPVRT